MKQGITSQVVWLNAAVRSSHKATKMLAYAAIVLISITFSLLLSSSRLKHSSLVKHGVLSNTLSCVAPN